MNRFQIDAEMIVLRDVQDSKRLIEKIAMRKVRPRLPKSLAEIKLQQERRMLWLYDSEEKNLDKDFRALTRGKYNLEKVREEIRQDYFGGMNYTNLLISRMQIYTEYFEELSEMIMRAWNISPRWELGGHSPNEFKKSNPDLKPQFSFHKTTIQMAGRNDPCPCSSGKKYKKCCLSRLN